MGDAAPKGLAHRIGAKLVDWLSDRVFEWVASLGIAALAWAWLRTEWSCIQQLMCQVPGWWHGTLIVLTAVATAAAVWFGRAWYRSRGELRAVQTRAHPPPFRDIEVEDRKLKLRWFIRRPPREWLGWRDVAQNISPGAVHQVLDGPFHAAPGCSAPVREIPAKGLLAEVGQVSPTFDEHCSQCGGHIFQSSNVVLKVEVWPVRAAAIQELQRMHRNGTKLRDVGWTDPVVLQNPDYWKLMLPPR